jgi:hypothetical protein
MASSLLSLITQSLTPDVIARIAAALGLDRMVAQKAIGGAIPALLSSLANVASTPTGAKQLSSAVTQQPPGVLDSFKNLLGGPGQTAFTDTGSGMLSGLLGGETLGALTQSIGKFSGMGDGMTKSLLGMLGPVVVGTLGQQQRKASLDATGLASLLTAQKDQIAAAIPPGLADHLDATGLLDKFNSTLSSGTVAASRVTDRIGGAADWTAAGTSPAAYAAGDRAPSAMSSSLPLWVLGLVLLGGLGWYFMGSETDKTVVEQPTRPAVTAQPAKPVETVGAATPTVGNFSNKVASSVSAVQSALLEIKDAASAQAALPKLREAVGQIDEISTLSAGLPADSKKTLANLIGAAIPAISQLCDKALAVPGVSAIAGPVLEDLRGKLDTLARA